MSITLFPDSATDTRLDKGGAAFTLDRDRALRLPQDDLNARDGDYLARALARHPGDLVRHVQRIYYHTQKPDPARLYGALVDLFIVLGPRGTALRRRMFNESRVLIAPRLARRLEEAMTDGLIANHHLGDVPGSVLGRPIQGSLDLVCRSARVIPELSVLDEARALLNDGQVDKACRQLEDALAKTPHDAALAEELLLIYRATKNRQGYEAVRSLLQEANTLPPSWLQFKL